MVVFRFMILLNLGVSTILTSITFVIVQKMYFLLTFEPHDAIVTALEEQLIYNEGGWDGLRGCRVDSGAIILKETKGILTVNKIVQPWLCLSCFTLKDPG